MTKTIVKIFLDEKPIGTKPFQMSDSLASIRQKLKDKIKVLYNFLDQYENQIDIEDENEMALENVINEKIIKLKSKGNDEFYVNIYFNEKNICSVNCTKKDKLNDIRNLIYNKIKKNFVFLDPYGSTLEIDDEKDYMVEDILINEIIKISIDSSDNFPPAIPSSESTENKNKINLKKDETPQEEIDFSQYKIIKKKGDLTIYQYSDCQKKNISDKLVYEYFYDDIIDDFHNAYVILFCGKTGEGKTTAINAFFNIIKGIKLEYNYRFILISEPEKEKGQAVSQTDGVHLYYLKDYNNNPVIIIDSQGYGDTRGKTYDEKINESFSFVFSDKIDHINAVCFISKATNSRLDIQTQYIFSSVTSLFSEDISENFMILATHATKDSIEEGPCFIDSIKEDAGFLKIQDRMDDKWWYLFDSKSIINYKDKDILTTYSFEQLTEFYEEKVKKLRKKSIKNCSKVLKARLELKIQINNLKNIFKKLLVENKNLKEKKKIINEICNKIKNMENEILKFETEKNSKNLTDDEIEQKIIALNKQLEEKINELNNQTITEQILSKLKNDKNYYTICNDCKKNCHAICDCNFSLFYRCKVFSWGIFDYKKCYECGCLKEKHEIGYNYYALVPTISKKDNTEKIQSEKKKSAEEQIKFVKKINERKSNFDKQINKLNDHKAKLLNEKETNIKEKNEVETKIVKISNEISFILIKLKNLTQRINDIAMNNNHLEIEQKYIRSLKEEMETVGIKNEEQENYLKEMEEKIKIYIEVNKFSEEDIFQFDDSQIASKLGIIIPCYETNDGMSDLSIKIN